MQSERHTVTGTIGHLSQVESPGHKGEAHSISGAVTRICSAKIHKTRGIINQDSGIGSAKNNHLKNEDVTNLDFGKSLSLIKRPSR